MTTDLTMTRQDRIALARQYHARGAIIQHGWQRTADDGKHLVCALAAFGKPGEITSAASCPGDIMPLWMRHLVPAIDDGIAADQVMWFSGELIDRAERWHVLDDAAWERIRTGFMIAGIRRAIEAATTVHAKDPPEYWPGVVSACDQVCTALETGQGLAEAEAAARAAEAAAWAAARAAARAAEAAAWAAEAAAARAAEAAARAAEAAAWAAWAAEAAAEAAEAAARAAAWAAEAAAWAAAWAAWKTLAETLFQLIDVEIAAVETAGA